MATPGKRATPRTLNKAREMYGEGFSYAAIGREVDFGSVTVSKWAKDGNWVRNEDKSVEAAVTPDFNEPPIVTTSAPDVIYDFPEPLVETAPTLDADVVRSEQDLRDRLAVLEERNSRLEAENEKLKPTVDVSAMIADRVQWITDNSPTGDKHWVSRAEAQFKKENRTRAKDGLPPFNINDHPDMLDDIVNELKTKEAMDAAKEPTEPPSRKIKMLIMREQSGGGVFPTIEQIPLESQINNMKGSLADGIVRYTRKGFKLTSPMLCPRAGCFRPCEVDEFERWKWDGYCSEVHRTQVEGSEPSQTAGLQVKDTIFSAA